MEFFLPGLFLFIVTLWVTMQIAPRMTPFIASILSIALLSYGVYHHYKLFAAEYRLSTWQEGLKVYSPAIMILAVILFILYGILFFFTKGQVPVPSMPNIALPSANSITGQFTDSMESMGNSMVNSMNNMISSNKTVNSLVHRVSNSLGANQPANRNKNKGNNVSRSFLETV